MPTNSPSNSFFALVTGATTGIGYELSKCLAADGKNLVLVARNESLLQQRQKELAEQYGVEVVILPKDLSEVHAASEVYEFTRSRDIEVDELINNAGFGLAGEFARLDREAQWRMMQLNMVTLVDLSHYYLQDMLKHGQGGILNVASTAAFTPGPLMTIYYATKAFVYSFSMALSKELQSSGVRVTVLCPGPTPTEFQQRAGLRNSLVQKFGVLDAETVARKGYAAFKKGKRRIIPGFWNKLSLVAMRITPDSLLLQVIHWMQKNRE